MPRGNATGPMGMGPMTGRMAGYCAGYKSPGYMNNAYGRGFGTGSGRCVGFGGRGFRNRFYATGVPGRTAFGGRFADAYPNSDPEAEKQFLSRRADFLQKEADAIKKRLAELNIDEQKK